MTKWIAAIAAASLAATPALAESTRQAAPIEDSDALAGGGGIAVAWAMAAVLVVGVILALVDDDDNDFPVSP